MTTASDLIRDFLSKNSLFDGFSEYQLEQIVTLADIVHYKVDELIVKENDLSTEIFIIKEGEVIVKKTGL